MNTIVYLSRNLWSVLGCVVELLGYLLRFVSMLFRTRASLAARLLAAESQLGVCKRRIDQKAQPKPRFTAGFRFLWVVLSKLWAPWQAAAQLMQPATVKAWHTRAFKLYWRWKSRRKVGRLPISHEMRDLIRQLSRENAFWGAGQIRDHLLLLHYDPPCEDTIRKYMVKPKNPQGRSTTWLPFLQNHMDVSWAIDFLTVNTIRFATLYVFLVLHHGRRKVVHFSITSNPSMGWVIQQLREAMPYGRQPRFAFRDSDGIYGGGVRGFLDSCGIEEVRTAYRCPWQNPFVERLVGTLCRELLDHVIVLGQGHLERLLREFIEGYYHVARPHQGLDGDTPIPQPQTGAPITGPTKLISAPILGGLHHRYQRVAA
jgi:transposase InsO family protein